MSLFVQHDLPRDGGLQRLDDHLPRIGVILDDIDLLAAELAHDRLHARSARSDAGAYRVHLRIGAGDGNLGPVTGLPRKCLDLHRAVGDLSHLELKQAANKLRAGATENDLRATRRALDLEQQAANALTGLVLFARHLLFARHHGLGLAEIHKEVVALTSTHRTRHDVADLVLEVVVYPVLLELTQPLHHRLPRRLGGNPAEGGGIDFLLEHFAEHRARLHHLGLFDMDLRFRITDGINDLQHRPSVQLTILGIDIDLQFLTGINALLGRSLQRIRNRGDHVGTRDALFFLHVFQDR